MAVQIVSLEQSKAQARQRAIDKGLVVRQVPYSIYKLLVTSATLPIDYEIQLDDDLNPTRCQCDGFNFSKFHWCQHLGAVENYLGIAPEPIISADETPSFSLPF